MEKNENLGQTIDRLENVCFSMKLPLPPAMHLQQLREILPSIVEDLKNGFIESTGNNPWL